jgi:hypothetical protein
MDWLEDFKRKFGNSPELKNVKAKKMKGCVQINFSGGEAKNCNVNQYVESEKGDG